MRGCEESECFLWSWDGLQGNHGGRAPWLGWFGIFYYHLWQRVAPQIKVHPTKVRHHYGHPVVSYPRVKQEIDGKSPLVETCACCEMHRWSMQWVGIWNLEWREGPILNCSRINWLAGIALLVSRRIVFWEGPTLILSVKSRCPRRFSTVGASHWTS